MSIFLLNCIEVSKEKRIFISLILFRCAKRFILPQKTKTPENESEVFRVKIPQRKVTKCNTYKNSLSFTMVSLQFSKKFYYSGCLTSSLNPVKNKGIVQKYTISISNGNIQKKCVNPLGFNFLRIHNLMKNPLSHQLWIYSSQKKEKIPYPRCGLGACLRCG